MFCMYCGKPTEGESEVCAICAAAHDPAVPSDKAPCEPLSEQDDTFVLSSPDEQPPKKRGKRGAVIAVSVLAAAALCVLLVGLNWNNLVGFWMRNFSSPKEYMLYVEANAFQEQFDSLSEAYDTALYSTGTTAAMLSGSVQMHLLISDELLDIAELSLAQSGAAVELSWLSDILLDMYSVVNEDQMQAKLGIGLGYERITTVDVLQDHTKGTMFIGLPDLSDTYLSMNMGTDQESDMSMNLPQQQETFDALANSMPSNEDLLKLLYPYIQIVTEHIHHVEKNTALVEAGSISQEMTVLTVTVYEKDALEMAIALLTALQADEQMQELVCNVITYLSTAMPQYNVIWNKATGTYEYAVVAPEDSEQILADWIDESLQTLRSDLEVCGEESLVAVSTYVDGRDSICGRSVSITTNDMPMGFTALRYGDDLSLDAVISSLHFTGSGSYNGSEISGIFTISDDEMSILTLEFQNWDVEQNAQGQPSGTIRMVPGEAVLEELMGDLPASFADLLSSKELALTVGMDHDPSRIHTTVNLELDGQSLIGLEVSGSNGDGAEIQLPTNTVDSEDQEAIMNWILGMEFDTLLENMKTAGVPADYVDILNSILSMLKMQAMYS